ncbi:acyl-CoA dehydrogenase family protein [Actinophytocola oryzae]|uniref:Alkylation response protein AidB-like acyl-CoA dehydrogenase n=1 Tax=Actinophytocola oryzae TaxID=502181 RepID=A0A4R7W4G9_9PSEU|nr:acyl-CoA dehydrogenase family protein [Actinophytocola oryzae]TDV56527.1 alkylation response protein AidB-like acyl-CoA dehydrogenase [Actinophytocola oryzae]
MTALEEFRALLTDRLPAEWVMAAADEDVGALEECGSSSAADEVVRLVAADGWLTPEWPPAYGGRGLGPDEAVAVRTELRRWRIGNVASAIGTSWVGPAILRFGEDAAKARLLPPIARNEALWCQLFSEPEAGSDLAAVRTRARRDGDHWVLDGTKIWTSRADIAQWGLALARTDGSVPKHAGLTTFCVDMSAPGVRIRPIRQLTGDSEFFEVVLDGVVVADTLRLGEPGSGWEVVRGVLAFERSAGSGTGAAPPGSVVGRGIDELTGHFGELSPTQRDEVVRVWMESRVIALNNLRGAVERASGRGPIRAGAPYNKILQAEHTKRLQELFVDLAGMAAVARDPADAWTAANVWAYLRVQAKTIAGGTSEVLRNQVAERALGLPREPDPTRKTPWQEVVG